MAPTVLHIPRQHVAWFRTLLAEEVCCDLAEAPDSKALERGELEQTAAVTHRGIELFEQVGYPGESEEADRELTIGTPYAAYMIRMAANRLGEDMKTAAGDYESCDLDLAEVGVVSARGAWIASLPPFGADIIPTREVDVTERGVQA